jgi:hypothetical protein
VFLLHLQKGAKLSLLEAGLDLEEFGGDVQAVEISALKVTALWFFINTPSIKLTGCVRQKMNLDKLESAIMTAAELQDLRGDRFICLF